MLSRFKKLAFPMLGLTAIMFLSACKSSEPFERSRKEYDYVPPVMLPTPVPEVEKVAPAQSSEQSMEEGMDSEKEPKQKKSSLFGRLFSKNKDPEAQPTITRVGDLPEIILDEEGNPVENQNPPDKVYRLKAGDLIVISLSGSGGINDQIETVIDDEGSVKLRFIGAVKAQGLSATELESEIEKEYTERQKIYKDVTVRVNVPNTFYFIGGEIRQPGRFPLIGRVTLSQAVVAAGNFTEWADEGEIVLVRNKERVVINFKKIRQNPNLDVELLAGDVINVSSSTF